MQDTLESVIEENEREIARFVKEMSRSQTTEEILYEID